MNIKLFFAAFFAAALLTTAAAALTLETVEPTQETAAEQEQATLAATSGEYGDLTYRISDGKVSITGCDTSAASVTIPETIDGYPVTCIDRSAFYGCTGLTSIVISDGVTSISSFAFYGCTGLTSITIPDSVTSIGSYAFEDCANLSFVDISDLDAWCRIDFDGIYATPLYYGAALYVNGVKPAEVVLPDGITAIKNYAFYNLKSLTSITIPDSVTSVGVSAFRECTGLTSITIGDGVTSIGSQAFYRCTGLSFVDISGLDAWCRIDFDDFYATPLRYGAALYVNGVKPTEVILPDGLTAIKDFAFDKLKSLTSITIPDSVTSIGYCAFQNCTGLTSITMQDSVTSIGDAAFSGCTSLTSVTIPDSVTSIGVEAFLGCTELSSVILGNSVTSIGEYAFDICNLKSIIIPISVTSFGKNAFESVSSVYVCDLSAWCKINFESNTFGNHTLYVNGTRVEQLILPSGMSTIAAYTFAKTSGIKSVVIPKDVKTISQYAFGGCNSITKIYYTGTAAEWECVRIADNNGSLSTATVYTDYVPDAMKITFSANTTDTVSSLPNAASAIGSYTLPATVPVRAGYKFFGWATVPDGKAAYQPGDTVEIAADMTFYAVWAETDKVTLSGITLKNTAYEPISAIPAGDFIAEVALTNHTYNGVCNILLATYDKDGRMLNVGYLYADPANGQKLTFGRDFSNTDGKIAKIKAFVWSDLQSLAALCPAVARMADEG